MLRWLETFNGEVPLDHFDWRNFLKRRSRHPESFVPRASLRNLECLPDIVWRLILTVGLSLINKLSPEGNQAETTAPRFTNHRLHAE
jgi:hypothetical protein